MRTSFEMMKKVAFLLLILSVPVLLYLNVWQAFRYRVVETEIELYQTNQQKWIEKNKNIIVGIEVLSAPSRINELAPDIEGLSRNPASAAIRIKVDNAQGGDNG